ncbi:MAG: HupE/UreJ family protein [Cocleimonas sp.]
MASIFIFTPVISHEIQPSIIDFSFNKERFYQLSMRLNIEALIAEVGSQHDDTTESDNTSKYEKLRQLDAIALIQEFEKFESTFLDKVQLFFNGKKYPLSILDLEIDDVGDIELARDSIINFAGVIPDNTHTMSWQWDASYGNAVFRVASDSEPELYSSYLLDGKASEKITIGTDCTNLNVGEKREGCTQKKTKFEVFLNYINVGFVHIIPLGLDHILFVVGLFLLSTQLKPLLIQITSFTIAHSISLALGIFGIITVSPAIIEPLIAVSIIYVCIENILSDKLSRWRPILVFLFGLLHGLGFASVLTKIGLTEGNFISGLLGFNLGVEFGQLAVIALCVIFIGIWFGKKSWYRERITIPASVMIAIIAAYWVIERTGLITIS